MCILHVHAVRLLFENAAIQVFRADFVLLPPELRADISKAMILGYCSIPGLHSVTALTDVFTRLLFPKWTQHGEWSICPSFSLNTGGWL